MGTKYIIICPLVLKSELTRWNLDSRVLWF